MNKALKTALTISIIFIISWIEFGGKLPVALNTAFLPRFQITNPTFALPSHQL